MKCEYCGGTLYLEDENCPYCGRPNPHAKKHIEDMRRYQGEFENTKKYVYDKTRTYTQVVVRMVILAVLVILSVGLYVLDDNMHTLIRRWEQNRSVKKYDEYCKILDGYLEEEDYRAFSVFCQAHMLDNYYGEYAEKYGKLIWANRYYVYLMDYLSDYAFPKRYTTNLQAKWVAEEMEYFYKYLENPPVAYMTDVTDDPMVTQALEKMEKNVQDFLIVFCGFTREEAQSMRDMNNAKRQILLEEKLEGRLINEE